MTLESDRCGYKREAVSAAGVRYSKACGRSLRHGGVFVGIYHPLVGMVGTCCARRANFEVHFDLMYPEWKSMGEPDKIPRDPVQEKWARHALSDPMRTGRDRAGGLVRQE